MNEVQNHSNINSCNMSNQVLNNQIIKITMQPTTQTADIETNTLRFSKFSKTCSQSQSLTIVSGPSKSGKSVTIDLLTNKQITQLQDQNNISYMAEDNNFQCNYDPIYFQSVGRNLFLQGFVLTGEDKEERNQLNYVKSIFIKQAIKNINNLSFVIAVEQVNIQLIPNLTQNFLEQLNFLDKNNEEEAKIFAEHVYLLLTKTEEDDPCDRCYGILEELIENAQSEIVRFVLSKIRDSKRIGDFPNKQIQAKYGQTMRGKFKPIAIKNFLKPFLVKEQPVKHKIKAQQESKSMMIVSRQLLKTVFHLLYWLIKGQGQQQYEKNMKQLDNQKQKWILNASSQKMINKNWKYKGLSEKINEKFKQLKENKKIKHLDYANYRQIFKGLITILDSLRQTAPNKDGYTELRGIAVFLYQASTLISEQQFSKKIADLLSIFNNISKLLSLQKTQQENQVRSNSKRLDKKPGKKQSKFNVFKDKLSTKQTNEEVLECCLKQIAQKQKQKGNEWSTIIFELKIVQDLLRQFDSSQQPLTKHYLANELLQLYIFNDSIYQFQYFLDLYIASEDLSISTAKKLIKTLDSLRRYDAEIKIINYVMSNSYEEQEFDVMDSIKNKVVFKANEEYLKRVQFQCLKPDKKNLPQGLAQSYQLDLTIGKLKDKMKDVCSSKKDIQKWKVFLSSDSFKQYLIQKQKK